MSDKLEKQFILRLPERVAQLVKDLDISEICLGLKFDKNHPNLFTLKVNGSEFKGILSNLPCVIESHKSLDGSNFFKSADIGQILQVFDNESDSILQVDDSSINLTSGLTPPTKDIVKRRWRSPPDQNVYAAYEKEILRSVRGGADVLNIEILSSVEYQHAEDEVLHIPVPEPKAKRYLDPSKVLQQ